MEDKQTLKELKIEDVDIKVLKSTAWDLGVEIEERKLVINAIVSEINRRKELENMDKKEKMVEENISEKEVGDIENEKSSE